MQSASQPEPYKKRPLDVYFETKNFERDGRIYKNLGVKQAQAIVKSLVGHILRISEIDKNELGPVYTQFIGKTLNQESLKRYEFGTRLNELQHIFVHIYFIFRFLHYLGSVEHEMSTCYGVALTMNFYLIMIQRYNRARVTNILENRYK